MDENRVVELVTRKIAGEANAEELGELSYLLKKYPDANYYEALLEQVWELGEPDKGNYPEQAFKDHKLKYKQELKFKKPLTGFRALFRKPVVFTFTFLLVLAAGALILNGYRKEPKKNVEIVAGRGVRKEIKLPDGTLVRLNSESKIAYDPGMLENESREIEVSGEAYFKIAPDSERAFIAKTSNVEVRAIATEFNIREYPGENRSETTLLKGSIELTVNNRPGQKFILKPSEKFAFIVKGKGSNSVLMIEQIAPLKLGNEDYIKEVSWLKNRLVFQDESFEELIPKLERWYNVDIELDDPKIRSLRFTGVYIYGNIAEVLEAMKLDKPFKYTLAGNQVKIYN